MVLSEDSGLDTVNLPLLLANAFLKVGQLILQRLDHLFGYFLLLAELLGALDGFPPPVLVFLAHTVHVVCHEID